MFRTPRLILTIGFVGGLAGALVTGCAQPEQTAQAVYAPPAASPDAVVSGARTPGLTKPDGTPWPTRSGINGDIDNPSGAPGPGISTGTH